MRDIVVFCGSSHKKLGQNIAERLGIPLGAVNLSHFSNNESSVQILESVRDMNVFIIQSGCGNVNDNLMELLIMINACKMASAAKVTVVIPCFPYARQPDAPYKQNGMPKRTDLGDVWSKPTTKQNAQQRELRSEQKLAHLNVKETKESSIFGGGSVSKSETGSSSPEKDANSSHSGDEGSCFRTAKKFSHLEISSAVNGASSETHTLISSPMYPVVTPLGLAKTGNYKHWAARSGTLVANMITAAGANHIITMDLHDPQFQGFFDIPVDNLYGSPLFVKYIREKIPNFKQAVIVSPDAGGAKRASSIAHKLSMPFALIHKDRRNTQASSPNEASESVTPVQSPPMKHIELGSSEAEPVSHFRLNNMMLVGNVKDKTCILIDDIADTSRTITRAANILHVNGAKTIYAIVTHGILSGDAALRIKESNIDFLVVSNSVPQENAVKILGDRIRVFDVAGIFAEAIRRVHHGESVSYLFEPVDI